MDTWKCLRCGSCCKDLYEEHMGMKFGMMLLKDEISLFPAENVNPLYRIGRVVIAYQLDMASCPHYSKEMGCGIEGNKPMVCHAFPFTVEGKTVLSVSANCSWKEGEGVYTIPPIMLAAAYFKDEFVDTADGMFNLNGGWINIAGREFQGRIKDYMTTSEFGRDCAKTRSRVKEIEGKLGQV